MFVAGRVPADLDEHRHARPQLRCRASRIERIPQNRSPITATTTRSRKNQDWISLSMNDSFSGSIVRPSDGVVRRRDGLRVAGDPHRDVDVLLGPACERQSSRYSFESLKPRASKMPVSWADWPVSA